MKCVICKTGTTESGKTNTMFERDGNIIIVKDIPADIRTQCGEAFLMRKPPANYSMLLMRH